jgi:hypothetical protein
MTGDYTLPTDGFIAKNSGKFEGKLIDSPRAIAREK